MSKTKSKTVRKADPKVPTAIELDGLNKLYGDFVALGPLSLAIPAGQRVTLIGANGSGKTTLLRLLTGLLDSTEGEATIFGEPAGSIDARANVSYLPDEPVLYDDLSVEEHIEYLGPVFGATDWRERGQELLQRLGIAHRASDVPSGFSRGLRQKTSLLLGFLRPFSILLIDEPFVGLDEPGRKALVGLLDEATERGATVVIASHQLDLVRKADRCIALAEGQITFDGSPTDIRLESLVGADE